MPIKASVLLKHNLSFTPYDTKWIPSSNKLCSVGATSNGLGKIAVYGLEDKRLELKQETELNSAVRCGAVTGPTRHFATGDFDGQLQTWDIQRLDIPVTSFKAHNSIINSMDSFNQNGEPQELVTGSRDGCVKVWDMRQPEKAVLTVRSDKDPKDIWAVAFGVLKGHRVIAVGYENGDIKLFSVDTAQYIWESQLKGGICAIDFDKERLCVSTLVGAQTIDLESGKMTDIVQPTDVTLWSIRHVPQQPNYFSVVGGDGNLTTFDTKSSVVVVDKLKLSQHPIISLDWHKDKKGLFATSSFDQTIKIGMLETI